MELLLRLSYPPSPVHRGVAIVPLRVPHGCSHTKYNTGTIEVRVLGNWLRQDG